MRARDQEKDSQEGHRRGGGRTVVRLDTAALWDRLELLDRSQNWLAREAGMSQGYLSRLVNEGRAPSEGIRLPDARSPRPGRLQPAFHTGGDR